jgi:hypothetical protein
MRKRARRDSLADYVAEILKNAVYEKGERLDVIVAEAPDLPGCMSQGAFAPSIGNGVSRKRHRNTKPFHRRNCPARLPLLAVGTASNRGLLEPRRKATQSVRLRSASSNRHPKKAFLTQSS